MYEYLFGLSIKQLQDKNIMRFCDVELCSLFDIEKPFYASKSILENFAFTGDNDYIYSSMLVEALILNSDNFCWFYRGADSSKVNEFRDANPKLKLMPICIDELPSQFPKTLEEKIMRVVKIFSMHSMYGQPITLPLVSHFCFSKDHFEAGFIYKALQDEGYCEGMEFLKYEGGRVSANGAYKPKLTLKGWSLIEQDLPINKSAFVAMYFTEELNPAFNAIQDACRELGIEPIRIDQVEHNNQIVDEIFYKIRHCGFTIADFTGQRGGVYFEAGYAKGLGKEVIWTCKKEDFDNLHFDTKQYSFIIWKDEAELKRRLIDRIRATILP